MIPKKESLTIEFKSDIKKLSNQEIFEAQGAGENLSSSTNSKTYSKYSITTDDNYNYIARINNTVLYSFVDKKYKDKVNKLIKKLGY